MHLSPARANGLAAMVRQIRASAEDAARALATTGPDAAAAPPVPRPG
jgi:hypothetical protein